MALLSEYRFGQVKVDGATYFRDLIVCGEEVLCPWVRREGHRLLPEDLSFVVRLTPRVLVVGTGAAGRLRVPESTIEWATRRGISLVVCPTGEAVLEFNDRAARGDKVGACLHLTC